MDSSQFDQLARVLAGSSTRRGALGILAGLVATTVLDIDPLAAKKRKHKNRRKRRGKGKKNHGGAKPESSVCEKSGGRTCDLSHPRAGVNWEQCNLADAGLVGASLTGMLAEGANFTGAHLLGADLRGAHLDNACFSNANLRGANLRGVIARNTALDGADLCGADLQGTNLTSKQIAAASVCCATRLPDGKSALPCPTGQECCGVACTDLRFDRGNCGACGNICAGGDICCNGDCVAPHPDGLCGLGGPACIDSSQDLQQVFDAASDGQTIQLCADTWELFDTLLINKNLNIFGPVGGSAILSGKRGEETMQVLGIRPNVNVAIGNVEFTQGKADEGAGIFNQGSLALYDCKVTENEATFGGGIYNEGNLYLYNTTVVQNAVNKSSSVFDPEYNGGGIYNDEGTVVLYGGTVVSGNTANDHTRDFGLGGGLFNNYGDVTVKSNVQFINNHAGTHGGGLYNRFGTMTFESGSKVTANVSGTGNGGGLYDEFDCCSVHEITIANASVITGNTPNNCAGDSAQVTNCAG